MRGGLVPIVVIAGVALAPSRAAADETAPEERAAAPGDEASELARDELVARLRHRLPARVRGVLDAALVLRDLSALPHEVAALSAELRSDPVLGAIVGNLAKQYRPHLVASAYVGALGESSGYLGGGVGIEADLVAPLCRYLGGSFDGQAYEDGGGPGLAWSGRVTGCLPWGPFAIELGFLSRHDVRVGLDAPPTSPGRRYDAQGVELRLRGFRWIEPDWEVVTIPAEVVFLEAEPGAGEGGVRRWGTIDSAMARYIRYGAGPGGRDRVVEVLPVGVTSQVDPADTMLGATVMDVGAVRLTGMGVGPGLYLDASLSFQDGRVSRTGAGERAPALASAITAGTELALHRELGPYAATVRYRRGLLPDTQLRLLAEDRGELEARYTRGPDTAGAGAFVAYTRTVATPPDVEARPADAIHGAHLEYGRALDGTLYLTARTEAARSFYAGGGADTLLEPLWELRASLGVAASWSRGP